MKNKDQAILFEYIRELLYDTNHAKLDRSELSEDCSKLAEGLEYFGEVIKDEKRVLDQMALGNMDEEFKISHNYLNAPVKTIQSNLKHLSWVAKRVAAGDYQQHVSSLGSFSNSFNEMIKQLSEYRDKMEMISNTDALTGVKNRRAFNAESEKLWQEHKIRFMVFIDLDGLKYCNDTYGHLYGDQYIKAVCEILLTHLKETEQLYRMGGDEFLILSQEDDLISCKQRLSQIRKEFIQQMEDRVPFSCDFSYGCVDLHDCQSMSECLSLADQRMYEYKMTKPNHRK